jgi:cellobiose-specific phosphotransferase system component IIA
MLINNTVDTVNVSLWYSPKSFMYYQTLTQMEESFRLQTSMLGADARETEEIKVSLITMHVRKKEDLMITFVAHVS